MIGCPALRCSHSYCFSFQASSCYGRSQGFNCVSVRGPPGKAAPPLGTGVPTDSTSAVRWPPPVGLGWAILRAISKCLRQVSTSDPKTVKSPVCIIAKGFHPVPRTLPTSCWNETGSTANLFFFLSFSHLFSDLLHLALFSEHCNLN